MNVDAAGLFAFADTTVHIVHPEQFTLVLCSFLLSSSVNSTPPIDRNDERLSGLAVDVA